MGGRSGEGPRRGALAALALMVLVLLTAACDGSVTPLAGAGPGGNGDLSTFEGIPAGSAPLPYPRGLATDAQGDLYIAVGAQVRRVDAASGLISTVAGTGADSDSGDGGPATSASLRRPWELAVDGTGNLFILEDSGAVRRVDATTGVISTILPPTRYDQPIAANCLAVDAAGNVYLGDGYGQPRVYRIDAATHDQTVVAGNGTEGYAGDGGPATDAAIEWFDSIALTSPGKLFIEDNLRGVIRKVELATGIISTVAGTGVPGFSGDGGPATSAQLYLPMGMAADALGDVYFFDSHRIRRVDAATGVISTVAGTGEVGSTGDGGPAQSGSIDIGWDLAVDVAGNLYLSEYSDARVRRVDASTGIISTFAGTGVVGDGSGGYTSASTSQGELWPAATAMNAAGDLFIADQGNRVRVVRKGSGQISPTRATGAAATRATVVRRRARCSTTPARSGSTWQATCTSPTAPGAACDCVASTRSLA